VITPVRMRCDRTSDGDTIPRASPIRTCAVGNSAPLLLGRAPRSILGLPGAWESAEVRFSGDIGHAPRCTTMKRDAARELQT
jgi:hypothetical protein